MAAKTLTKEEWKEVEDKLKSFYSSVKLKCDGYDVSIRLQRVDQFKNALVVYINGEIKGEWFGEDCEERRRFFRPSTKSLMSAKYKKALKKMPKKFREEMETKSKYTTYSPYWTSFRSLKGHLIKQNTEIELVQE